MIVSPFLRGPDQDSANILDIRKRRSGAQEVVVGLEERIAVMCSQHCPRIDPFCAGTCQYIRTDETASRIFGSVDSVAVRCNGPDMTAAAECDCKSEQELGVPPSRREAPQTFEP